MNRNHKNVSIYKNKHKVLSKSQRERIERMLICIDKGDLIPVKSYFLTLLKNDKSTAGIKSTANRFSKELELKQTPAEVKMQEFLIELDVVFRSQRIVYYGNGKHFYILDFYIPSEKLAIEVDGGYHDNWEQKLKDDNRDKTLKSKGIRTIRFTNEDVLNNKEATIEKILKYAGKYSLQ